MRKLVPLIFAMLMLFMSMASAEYVFCQPDDFVNVRSKPSGEAIQWVNCGTWVTTDCVSKNSNGKVWVHVVDLPSEDSEGWICNDFLSDAPVHVETRTAYGVANGRLAIRKSPNTQSKVVGWIKNGEKCTVVADNGEWAITPRGYVVMEFLEFVEVMEDE